MKDFRHVIKGYDRKLTKTQKKITEYISFDMTASGFMTLEELSEKTGASTATIVRYSKALGFDGYSSMQECIRQSAMNMIGSSTVRETTEKAVEPKDREPVKELSDGIAYIYDSFNMLDKSSVIEAADSIYAAATVYIAGIRESYSTAAYLAERLGKVRADVRLIRSDGMGYPEQISCAGADDLLIAFFYPRYSKDTAAILSTFRSKGGKTVVFTDENYNAITSYGDIFLPCRRKRTVSGYSYAAPVMLSDWLVDAVYRKDPVSAGNNNALMEELLEDSLYL